MERVEREQAANEVVAWLDYKRIKPKKREAYQDQIDILVDAVSDGDLIVNDETFELTYNLVFPFGEEETIRQFTFKPRLKLGDVKKHLAGVKATDVDGRLQAYISALTGQPKAILQAIDTEDSSVINAIAIFFV